MPKSRNPKIEIDRLQAYFGEPYTIDIDGAEGSVTVYQPSIGDIIRIGEKRFYSTLYIYTTNTTANRLMLWENGVDWCEMSDFDLFTLLAQTADPEVNKLLLGDLDITKFERVGKQITEDEQVVTFYNREANVEINEMVYFHISQYFRYIFNIYPEEKITRDSVLKNWYIDKDKRQREIDEEKAKKGKDKEQYSIQPLISAYLNHPGTKYKLKELKDVGICEFNDSVQRLQIYESATACMKGLYSGMVDGKKIKPEDYNFMKEITHN